MTLSAMSFSMFGTLKSELSLDELVELLEDVSVEELLLDVEEVVLVLELLLEVLDELLLELELDVDDCVVDCCC